MEEDSYFDRNPTDSRAWVGFWDLAWRILDCIDNWDREETEEDFWVTCHGGVWEAAELYVRGQPDLDEVFQKWVRHERWIVRALSAAIHHLTECWSFREGAVLTFKTRGSFVYEEREFVKWMHRYAEMDSIEDSSPCVNCGRYVSQNRKGPCPWCQG